MVECLMGLPLYGDVLVPDSGLTAVGSLNLRPDMDTLQVLPYTKSHARCYGDLVNDVGEPSPLCVRSLLKRMAAEAEAAGFRVTVGVEFEVVLRRLNADGSTGGPVDGYNFAVNRGLDENAGFLDDMQDMLAAQDVPVELVHKESAAGQYEIVLAYDEAVAMADHVITARETIAACARLHNLSATCVPKPFGTQAGNGMHMHFSLSEVDAPHRNIFVDPADPTLGVSVDGRAFMAGIVHHLEGLSAISTPSCNSFARIAPGCWSGAFVGWGHENKEAPVRLCTAGAGLPYHFELKTVDGTCNPYLTMAAAIAAGLSGVKSGRQLPSELPSHHGHSTDDLTPMPATFKAALDHLVSDPLFRAFMGDALFDAFCHVKLAEEAHTRDMKLEEQVAFMTSKGI